MKYKVTFISNEDKKCERFIMAVSVSDAKQEFLPYAKKILKIEACYRSTKWTI